MNSSVSNKIKLLLVVSVFFIGCNSNTNVYTGKTIKLEFAGVNTIQDQHWIEIDGIKYTHYQSYDLQSQDSYSLPSSKSRYEINGVERFEPNNAFSIALWLNNHIAVNSSNSGLKKAFIVPDEVHQLHVAGILVLHRSDSSEFSVKVPKDYPVKISVIN